jgi:putative membrane protein
MKYGSFAAFSLLALAACNRAGSDRDASMEANTAAVDTANTNAAVPAAAPGDAGVTTDPTAYVAQAGAGNLFEIESSRAVLTKTKNADVRKFAQMMIDNHQESTAKVKAAAASDKVTAGTPTLRPDQQTMLDDIKAADAASIDRIYLQHQRTAHTAALALHQGFAASQNSGQLKTTAGQIAAVVQKHLTELDRVEASAVGGR